MPADQPKRFRLRSEMRLRRKCDFMRIRLNGHRVTTGCVLLNWVEPGESAQTRFAVVVSNKLGSAVVRNRARRLLREVFRLHQHDLAKPVDMILVARPSIIGKKCAEVERDFLAALRKAGLVKNQNAG